MNPVVQGDMILISGAYYKVGSVLLRVKPDGKGVEEVWRSTALEIHWTTPILHEGYVYAFSGRNEPDARFRCVEFATGKVMWDRDESWPPHSSPTPPVYGRGSAILADGKLIALGEGGLLGLFKADPQKPEEISRFQVPGLHYPCWAAPILANGKLYLRSEDRLVCLNVEMRTADERFRRDAETSDRDGRAPLCLASVRVHWPHADRNSWTHSNAVEFLRA